MKNYNEAYYGTPAKRKYRKLAVVQLSSLVLALSKEIDTKHCNQMRTSGIGWSHLMYYNSYLYVERSKFYKALYNEYENIYNILIFCILKSRITISIFGNTIVYFYLIYLEITVSLIDVLNYILEIRF